MAFALDHRAEALIVSAHRASRLRLALITLGGKAPRTSRHRSQIAKEKVMSRRIAALILLAGLVGVGSARAQEVTPGPGKVEVTYIPAGAAYIVSKGDSPSFGNYGFGTAATFKVNRFIGIRCVIGGPAVAHFRWAALDQAGSALQGLH